MGRILSIDAEASSFKNDARKLEQEVLECLADALKALLAETIPKKYRMESLGGYKNPKIYTIHITPNHSHKLSFEISSSGVAVLRRIGTHKAIDRCP